MYYSSNNTKSYEFNVTWRVNTQPYYSTTTDTQVLRVGQDVNITFPVATDDESDPMHYFIVNSTVPGSILLTHPNSSETKIEFTGAISSDVGTYEFFLEPWEYSNQTYCGTALKVTLIVNTLPTYIASLSSNYQRTPYTSNSNITNSCPWFSDADGDSLTVSNILI